MKKNTYFMNAFLFIKPQEIENKEEQEFWIYPDRRTDRQTEIYLVVLYLDRQKNRDISILIDRQI